MTESKKKEGQRTGKDDFLVHLVNLELASSFN